MLTDTPSIGSWFVICSDFYPHLLLLLSPFGQPPPAICNCLTHCLFSNSRIVSHRYDVVYCSAHVYKTPSLPAKGTVYETQLKSSLVKFSLKSSRSPHWLINFNQYFLSLRPAVDLLSICCCSSRSLSQRLRHPRPTLDPRVFCCCFYQGQP